MIPTVGPSRRSSGRASHRNSGRSSLVWSSCSAPPPGLFRSWSRTDRRRRRASTRAFYLSAAGLFSEGWMPYRDFGFLHPPGILHRHGAAVLRVAVVALAVLLVGGMAVVGARTVAGASSRSTRCRRPVPRAGGSGGLRIVGRSLPGFRRRDAPTERRHGRSARGSLRRAAGDRSRADVCMAFHFSRPARCVGAGAPARRACRVPVRRLDVAPGTSHPVLGCDLPFVRRALPHPPGWRAPANAMGPTRASPVTTTLRAVRRARFRLLACMQPATISARRMEGARRIGRGNRRSFRERATQPRSC